MGEQGPTYEKVSSIFYELKMHFKNIKIAMALICALIGTATGSFGQKLQWSMPQRVTDRAFITECIGSNTEGLYVLKKNTRTQNRDIMVEHYSDDLHHVTSKVFANHRDEVFLNIFLDSAGLRMFYAQSSPDNKRTDIRLKNLNFNLAESGKDTTLFSLSGISPEQAMISVYKIKLNPYVLITYATDMSQYPALYGYLILDENYNKINSGNINIGEKNRLSIEQVTFTRDQACFLMREDAVSKAVKQGYRFYTYRVKFSDSSLTKTPLFNDRFAATEGILKTDFKNDAIVFAGLFANLDSSYVKGYCTWKYDLRSNAESIQFTPFPPEVVSEMEGRRIKVQGIFNLRAGDLDFRADGGLILSTEEYQETHENVSDFNAYGVAQPSVRNYYYYENLLILSINPAGNLDWHTVVRKDQVSVNDNGTFSSYVLAVLPDRLLYIYNDLTRKNWDLSVAEIDQQGKEETKVLVKPQNYDGRLIPQYGYQVSYNQFIIPELTPRGIVILRVSY